MDTTSLVIGIGIGLILGGIITFVAFNAMASGAGGLSKLLALAKRAKADPAFAAKLSTIQAGGEIKPPEPPKPAKPSGAALRMLALLQAEARLVDFLMEDISGAGDAQIGQAVREIHKNAQKALKQHAAIEPVMPGNEGETTTVPKGFDPSAVRVVGNVTGEPPFTGQINHPGWRVKELKLAPPPEGADEFVLQPAEVQIA
jgi:hypothetical protein